MTSCLSLKSILLLLGLLAVPFFGWLMFSADGGQEWRDVLSGGDGRSILRQGTDFHLEDGGKKVVAVPDSEMLSSFDRLKGGFEALDFSLVSERAFAAESIPKNISKSEDTEKKKNLTSAYDIGDVSVTTDYQESKNHTLGGFSPVKQTITLKNHASADRTIDFTNRIRISADEITWDGKKYSITEEVQTFRVYDKTASVPDFAKESGQGDTAGIEAFENYTHTYKTGASITFMTEGRQALYDWSDAVFLDPEIRAYRTAEGNFLEFFVKDIHIPAGEERVIDPSFGLNDPSSYDIRYSGAATSDALTDSAFVVGDVNGDGIKDLVISASAASNNGAGSGSAYVIFGGSGIAIGNKPLSTSTNYNIRYDGAAAGDGLTNLFAGIGISIGDVNGDTFPDLVLGTDDADNNGTDAGSAYVMFSTLIDDVGATTGNNKPLSTATNYNIRYDGGAASKLTNGGISIGDVNGDTLPDLLVGAALADNNGTNAGSAYVMFSTLIDDVGATTGNNQPLSTATNYNIRYDGGAASDFLTGTATPASGDVNGDTLPDLVLGASAADNNGASSGSAYVMFSTLIDDVGATTGNNKPLSTATNYNIRYDGGAASDTLIGTDDPSNTVIQIGDVSGDGLSDLVLGAYLADNNGSNAGSAYVMFSTLIDDVGATTGNNQPLSTATNYNIRYAGSAASDFLTRYGGLYIGDVNGDTFPDLVVGSAFTSSSTGSAWVMFGGSAISTVPDLYFKGSFNIQGPASFQ